MKSYEIVVHVENIFVDDERMDIFKVSGTCIFYGISDPPRVSYAYKRPI